MIDPKLDYTETNTRLADKLNSNEITVVRTASGYQIATLANTPDSHERILSFKEKDLGSSVLYLFSDIDHIKKAVTTLPKYVEILMMALNQGSVVFILSSNQTVNNSVDIACCLPAHQENSNTIQQLGFPLATSSANISGWPPATNIQMMEHYFGKEFTGQIHTWLDYTWLEPLVLNCVNDGEITIERPGIISFEEIRSILHPSINLKKDFKYGLKAEKLKVYRHLTSHIHSAATSVVLGTKRVLKSILEVDLPDYFHTFITNNVSFINLGSQSNPETVARNLYSNLFHARNQNADKVYILQDNWGHGNWAEVIEYNLKKYTEIIDLAE